MIRAVIDTNVIVSGLLFGGFPSKVIQAALSKEFTWVTSPELMNETLRVLRSPKFGLTVEETRRLTRPLWETVEIARPQTAINIIERCPADNRVLECALDSHCSYIVTGDRRDLLSLSSYRNIRIIQPRQFLELLR